MATREATDSGIVNAISFPINLKILGIDYNFDINNNDFNIIAQKVKSYNLNASQGIYQTIDFKNIPENSTIYIDDISLTIKFNNIPIS